MVTRGERLPRSFERGLFGDRRDRRPGDRAHHGGSARAPGAFAPGGGGGRVPLLHREHQLCIRDQRSRERARISRGFISMSQPIGDRLHPPGLPESEREPPAMRSNPGGLRVTNASSDAAMASDACGARGFAIALSMRSR